MSSYQYHAILGNGAGRHSLAAACDRQSPHRRTLAACPSDASRAVKLADECGMVGAFASAAAGTQCGGPNGSDVTTPLAFPDGRRVNIPARFYRRRIYVGVTGQAGFGSVSLVPQLYDGIANQGNDPSPTQIARNDYANSPACSVVLYSQTIALVLPSGAWVNPPLATPPYSINLLARFGYPGGAGGAQSVQIASCLVSANATPAISADSLVGGPYSFGNAIGSQYFVGRLTGRYGKKLTLTTRTTAQGQQWTTSVRVFDTGSPLSPLP